MVYTLYMSTCMYFHIIYCDCTTILHLLPPALPIHHLPHRLQSAENMVVEYKSALARALSELDKMRSVTMVTLHVLCISSRAREYWHMGLTTGPSLHLDFIRKILCKC